MNRKGLLLLMSTLLFSVSMMAQTVTVKGIVTDAGNNEPLVGVFVGIKGNNTAGTMTGIDGNYTLTGVKSNSVLVFSLLGYTTVEVQYEGKAKIDVSLKSELTELDQVVIVGYGSMKKKDLTGSIASVSSDKLQQSIATNIDQMLQGKVSGVQITQNSGAPGGATSIRVRGASSINNSNEPLYIIDGIPMSGSGDEIVGFSWAGGTNGQSKINPLSSIAPSDIVSIDILKDASATAIYGANGANGVILVTTRRGKKGNAVISYDGYVTQQQIGKYLPMMNLPEYAQYENEIAAFTSQQADQSFGDPSILGNGTDWQKEIFRTAYMQSHQVSVSGGSDVGTFAVSGGWTKQDGVVIGSDFQRFNSRMNADANIRTWLHAGGSLAFTSTDQHITNNDGTDGVIMQALTMQPSIPVYDLDGKWAGPNTVYGASQYNPVWLAEMKTNNFTSHKIMGNFYITADITKEINFRSEYGYDVSDNNSMCFVPTYSFGVLSSDINQIYRRDDHSSYWIWKNYATWNKSCGQNQFILMAGAELSRNDWSGNTINKKGLSNNLIKVVTTDGTFVANSGWKDAASTASFFGRLNYNYAERYLFTGTVRADGSSKFGSNNKYGIFPSASAAWRINQEDWMKDVKSISNLKLRVGYGQVGNSNIDTYLYGATMTSRSTPMGTAYFMSNIANPNLRWEATESWNIGLDLGLFDNRISLSADVYQKQTRDLLMQVTVPSYLGGTTTYNDIATPMVNIGKTRNRGVDMTLNTININKKNFQWSSNFVFSLNRNKVMAMNDDSQKIYGAVDWYSEFQTATLIEVGKPIGVFYGYVVDRLFTSEDDILNSPVQVEDPSNPGKNLYNKTTGVYVGDIKFKDLDNNGVIDDGDQTVIGDPNPDFTFGFTNTFDFYNFEIVVGLTGVYGDDILNFTRYRTEAMTSLWDNQLKTVTNRAQVGTDANGNAYLINTGTTIPRPSTNDFNRNTRMSTRYIEDGSYIRLQNLSVGYNVPENICQKISLHNLKVYVNGQNLYTLTKYSGYDPEIGAYNQSSLLQNIDRGRYPTPRSITLGVNIGF
jgi:TonB-linked outer membrane protein, SusC/RagA family